MDKRILNAITGRLSLRAPQEESLRALATALDVRILSVNFPRCALPWPPVWVKPV